MKISGLPPIKQQNLSACFISGMVTRGYKFAAGYLQAFSVASAYLKLYLEMPGCFHGVKKM